MIFTTLCIDQYLLKNAAVSINQITSSVVNAPPEVFILIFISCFAFFMKSKTPLKGIPMAPNCHWFLGHMKLFLSPDFEESWRALAYDNANEEGVCSFWVRRKPIVTLTKVEHARAACIAGSYRESTPLLTKHTQVLGGFKGLLVLNGKEWKMYRSIISRAFTPSSLEGMIPSMFVIAKTLVRSLSTKCRQVEKTGETLKIDMDFVFQMYTIDVLGRTIMGKDFKCCENLERNENLHAMDFLSREFIRRIGSPFNPAARYYSLPTSANRKHSEAQQQVRNYIKEIINEHRSSLSSNVSKNGGECKNANILKALTELDDLQTHQNEIISSSAKEIINEEIVDNVLTLYRAGFLTTASMLTYSIYRIALHSKVQVNCFEEAKRALRDNSAKINPQELSYIRSVIDETLRLHPTVFSLNRTLEKPLKISETITIPKGIHVFMPICLMQKDEKHFTRPLDFLPERWTKKTTEGDKWIDRSPSDEKGTDDSTIPIGDRKSLLSFSIGGRNCVGEKMARQELAIALAMLIRNFKFELLPTYELRPMRASVTQKPKDGMPMIITKRLE